MSDIFIAHVDEDADVALELALGLEEAGYATWSYEVDSLPGPSYLLQTGRAVDQSKAVILVISPHSLSSRQVTKEVVRAHESGKEFIPVRRGITHIEFQTRQPEWREAVGAAASIGIPEQGVASIVPRIVSGLKTFGIQSRPRRDSVRISEIRRAMAEVQRGGLVQKAQPPARVAEPEPEAVAVEMPRPKTAAKVIKRKRWNWKRTAFVASGTVALGIVVAVVVSQLRPPGSAPAPPSSPTPAPTTAPTSASLFTDKKLAAAVNAALNKPASYRPTLDELAKLEKLDALNKEISNLTGIEHCVNLNSLWLVGNQIMDIKPLASLTKLEDLHLENNWISDISALSSLTSLKTLYLDGNQISNISVLSSLTNLNTLWLNSNQISDIGPLAALTRLGKLSLENNNITDISALSSLTNLGLLSLLNNKISDIRPLASLTQLSILKLQNNQIVDVEPLVSNSGLSQGDTVYLENNPLNSTSVNVYIAQLKQRGVAVYH